MSYLQKQTIRAASLLRGSGFGLLACAALAWPAAVHAHPSPSHTLDEINAHLEDTPNDPALLRDKAETLIAMDRLNEATEISSQLLRAAPADPDNLYLAAKLTLLRGDSAQALARTGDLTRIAPGFAQGWNLHADLLYQAGRRDEAIAAKQKYLEISETQDAAEYITCADWLHERGKPGDAQAAIVLLDQGTARIGVLMGMEQSAIEIDLSLRQWDSALRRLDILTARFRPSSDLSVQRAEILTQAGRFQEAASAYDAAIAILQASPSANRSPEQLNERLAVLRGKQQAVLSQASAHP